MGLIRKMTSVSTLGLVDFRSDKERTARYTKQLRNEQRHAHKAERAANRQHVLMQQQHALMQAQTVAPGWYADPHGQPCQRWWDGCQWTGYTR